MDRQQIQAAKRREDSGLEQPRARPSENRSDVDLHGMTLAEAEAHIRSALRNLLASRPGQVSVRIITGKGLHSGEFGSVLARRIHELVSREFAREIVEIQDSPAETMVDGLPIRGHFDVLLKSV